MITKAQLKQIKSLQLKKNRQEQQRFLVEGAKSVLELAKSDFEIEILLCTETFISKNEKYLVNTDYYLVSEKQLESVGTFKNNSLALAVAKMKPNVNFNIDSTEMVIVLDDVRDPGNLGTIIRIADWYGITKIVASETTAEFYNPKVVNSTMGSFTRVLVQYTNLLNYLKEYDGTIIGAFMEGESTTLLRGLGENGGLIVMGNESNGISKEVETLITRKISIPKFGKAESLNVAVATAIICDNLMN